MQWKKLQIYKNMENNNETRKQEIFLPYKWKHFDWSLCTKHWGLVVYKTWSPLSIYLQFLSMLIVSLTRCCLHQIFILIICVSLVGLLLYLFIYFGGCTCGEVRGQPVEVGFFFIPCEFPEQTHAKGFVNKHHYSPSNLANLV